MDLNLNEQQVALSDTLRRFVEKEYTFSTRQTRLKQNERFNEKAWQTLAEIGVLALPFAEEDGGLDGDSVDTHVMMQSLAPALVLEPLVSTAVLGAAFIKDADDDSVRNQLIESVAGGEIRFSFANAEPQMRYDTTDIRCTAQEKDGRWLITGKKAHVIDAPSATHLLVTARIDNNETAVFVVKADASNLHMIDYPCHDDKYAADIEFTETVAEFDKPLIKSATDAIEWAVAQANNAFISEIAGLSKALTETTIEYLKTRKQFGVALSQFQALQHRLADMAVKSTQINAMAIASALAIQNREEADLAMVSGAKAFVCRLSKELAQEAIQLHGGVGVTDELIVSHLFKRAITISMTYGDSDYHLAKYGDATFEDLSQKSA